MIFSYITPAFYFVTSGVESPHTMPIPISTRSATITTSADIIKPWIIGRIPDLFKLENDVFKPIAANALTIRNLLTLLVPLTTASGMENTLATTDIARNPRINQGNIFAILKFVFNLLPSRFSASASLFFSDAINTCAEFVSRSFTANECKKCTRKYNP